MSPDERWAGIDDVTTHFGVGKDSIYHRVESRSLSIREVGPLLRLEPGLRADRAHRRGRGRVTSSRRTGRGSGTQGPHRRRLTSR